MKKAQSPKRVKPRRARHNFPKTNLRGISIQVLIFKWFITVCSSTPGRGGSGGFVEQEVWVRDFWKGDIEEEDQEGRYKDEGLRE